MRKLLVLMAVLTLGACKMTANGEQTDEPTEILTIKGLEGCLSYEIITHHRTVVVVRCPETTTSSYSSDGGKTTRSVSTINSRGSK